MRRTEASGYFLLMSGDHRLPFGGRCVLANFFSKSVLQGKLPAEAFQFRHLLLQGKAVGDASAAFFGRERGFAALLVFAPPAQAADPSVI